MNRETIAYISTYAALLPFISGVIVFRKAGLTYRLFTFFLLVNFLTDLFVGYYFNKGKILLSQGLPEQAAIEMNLSQSVFFIYILAEALFFAWFISRVCDYTPVSETAFLVFIILPFPWALAHINFAIIEWRISPFTNMFETVTSMAISILASWSILKLTEKEGRLVNMPDFWFLFAIFFYCFCTFFIDAFIQSPEKDQIWFIHNLINIMTYFIYAFGFLKIETKKL